MDPVRFGLVGYGFGGRHFHAPLLATAAGCQLVGVVTTSPERRAQVAADHPDTHTALTEQALDLGLAVVCDKPFALDAETARRTVARAAELGLALAPYQNRYRSTRRTPSPPRPCSTPPAAARPPARSSGSPDARDLHTRHHQSLMPPSVQISAG